MKATEALHERGQSLWLDNITRSLLDDGTIQRYIDSYSVTGLTSNPSIFDKAIGSGDYDDAIRAKAAQGLSAEELFFELAIEDLRRAADLFLPIHERTDGVDGWVSLEVSPLLAYDTGRTVEAAKALHARAGRANLFIKIPGTPEGLPAITEAIAAGVPVNVTLLFSADQYRAAADAYLKGVERRVADGLDPAVGSVASVFMSRWDVAVAKAGAGRPAGPAGPGGRARRLPRLPAADELRPVPAAGRTTAPGCSGCCGRAPAPRTRTPPTPCTCTGWPPRSRSTPCPTTPSRPSSTTARWAIRCRPTAATPTRCWPGSPRPAWTSASSRPSCSATAPRPSSTPGTS